MKTKTILVCGLLVLAVSMIVFILIAKDKPSLEFVQEVALYPINETIPLDAGSLLARNVYYRTDAGVVSDAIGVFASQTVMETDQIAPCYRLYKDGRGKQHIIYFVPVGRTDEFIQLR